MEKILVVAPSWVGDCVLMQPMLQHLLQRHPGVQLTISHPTWRDDQDLFHCGVR